MKKRFAKRDKDFQKSGFVFWNNWRCIGVSPCNFVICPPIFFTPKILLFLHHFLSDGKNCNVRTFLHQKFSTPKLFVKHFCIEILYLPILKSSNLLTKIFTNKTIFFALKCFSHYFFEFGFNCRGNFEVIPCGQNVLNSRKSMKSIKFQRYNALMGFIC